MKARASLTFDYTALPPETAAVARDAATRIRTYTEAQALAKTAWLHHARDIHSVRSAAQRGHFEGWVRAETPFTVRTAQLMSDAAKMLIDVVGGENFSSLPFMPKSVVYRLAAPSTPQTVRDSFLARLLVGGTVTGRDLKDALKPIPEAVAAPDETEAAEQTSFEPNGQAVSLAETLTKADASAVLRMLKAGRAEDLERALEARMAVPVAVAATASDGASRPKAATIETVRLQASPRAKNEVPSDDPEFRAADDFMKMWIETEGLPEERSQPGVTHRPVELVGKDFSKN